MKFRTPREALDSLELLESDHEQVEHAFLRLCGWDYTSELGSVWLWKKVVAGRGTIYVNASTARDLEMGDFEGAGNGLAE